MRGVYIATLINGSFSEENMRSVITFDKGGTWELLQPPAQTRYGEQIDCEVAWGEKGQGGKRGRRPLPRKIGCNGSPAIRKSLLAFPSVERWDRWDEDTGERGMEG